MKRAKLMRKRKKWGRCHVPGHSHCSVTDEIQHPGDRSMDKRDFERDLYEYELEQEEEDDL